MECFTRIINHWHEKVISFVKKHVTSRISMLYEDYSEKYSGSSSQVIGPGK